MKNLESLADEKFAISTNDLCEIKGGNRDAGGGTTDTCDSYTISYTDPGGQMDQTITDHCVYFDN